MLVKILALMFVFFWVRATLPAGPLRPADELGWKILLPLATLNVLVTAILVTVRGGAMSRTEPAHERRVPLPEGRLDRRGAAWPRARRRQGGYRAFGETLRGLKTTMARMVEGPVTVQYPEEKTPVYPRFRGRHKLHRFEDTGLEKCVGCSLCAAACPADCIRVVAAENDPDNRVSAGERYAAVYEINLARCIFCGYCEVACPFDAITMGHEYEMADYNRGDLIFTKEMLLAEPIERTPLAQRGRGEPSGARPSPSGSGGRGLRVGPDDHGVDDRDHFVDRQLRETRVAPERRLVGRLSTVHRSSHRPRRARSCGSTGPRPACPHYRHGRARRTSSSSAPDRHPLRRRIA